MTIRTNLSLEVIENCMNINNKNLCTYCFEEIFDSQGPCSSCGYAEGRKPQDIQVLLVDWKGSTDASDNNISPAVGSNDGCRRSGGSCRTIQKRKESQKLNCLNQLVKRRFT